MPTTEVNKLRGAAHSASSRLGALIVEQLQSQSPSSPIDVHKGVYRATPVDMEPTAAAAEQSVAVAAAGGRWRRPRSRRTKRPGLVNLLGRRAARDRPDQACGPTAVARRDSWRFISRPGPAAVAAAGAACVVIAQCRRSFHAPRRVALCAPPSKPRVLRPRRVSRLKKAKSKSWIRVRGTSFGKL